ncbi:MAG TPA: IS3 family transposase [Terrimicrobiaceae bacterium]
MKIIHSDRHTRCYGSPRMTRELRAVGIACSENRVARIMRSNGLRARPRRPFRPKTTQPDHAAHPSPNLLSEAGPPSAPGSGGCQAAAGSLATSLTFLQGRAASIWLSSSICSPAPFWAGNFPTPLHADLVVDATTRAIDSGLVSRAAIFHSDRGCQYSATVTRELLARHGLRQSMSAKGSCYDNAFSESAFASLKSEVLSDGLPFDSKAASITALFDYFETFYNRRRLHSSLGYLSPNAFLNRHFQNQNPNLN